jgi:hypothetical protein
MTDIALKLVGAFTEALSEDGYAVLRRRGGQPGYIHVVLNGVDPEDRQNRHVVIEMFNGTVAVAESLCASVFESPSDHVRPNERIQDNPRGYSAGPKYGRFKWALTHDEVVSGWGSELAFARKVTELLRSLESTGGSAESEGDYS